MPHVGIELKIAVSFTADIAAHHWPTDAGAVYRACRLNSGLGMPLQMIRQLACRRQYCLIKT